MDSNIIINELIFFIKCKLELKDVMKNINDCVETTFQTCVENCLDCPEENLSTEEKLKIESILDYLHDELNTGHWSECPITIRRAFTAASFIKTLILLKSVNKYSQNLLEECLKCLDMGLLLGAPLEENPDLLTESASFMTKKINELYSLKGKNVFQSLPGTKRKYSNESASKFNDLRGNFIDVMSCPSLETFNNKYFSQQLPIKLQDCMSHWPAATKWTDLNYLLAIAGDRTVPIEVGSHYVDENWSQKLMTLKDFIKIYFLGESDTIGYLAQHNLFNQISELRNDIYIPDYCCLGENESDPDINAWFGPVGTVSPLHYDPKSNILAQVFGTKQIILYSPKDSTYLYPHEGAMLFNTAQVNPLNPDLEKHPEFPKAAAFKCLLEPGEMLYIPPKWWHHVTALDKSFSVSFWWD